MEERTHFEVPFLSKFQIGNGNQDKKRKKKIRINWRQETGRDRTYLNIGCIKENWSQISMIFFFHFALYEINFGKLTE